jgi:flavin-dependent dehydrogenase
VDRSDYDVIIVGGGPAGTTAGTFLARDGHSVLLVEREKFPRDHVGESLLPFCYSLFEELGVRGQMDRMFVRKPGVRFLDRNGRASTTWCFRQVIHNETYLSYQVNRAPFDTMLLENTRRAGVDVREETKATDIDISDKAGARVTIEDRSGQSQTYSCRFAIDASGREAMIGTRNGWRKLRPELDRTALWSHWEGVTFKGGLEEGLSLILYMGEEKKGWIWVFPLTPTRVTAGIVMQNAYIRSQRLLLQERGSCDWKEDLCMQELLLSPFVRSLLEGAQRVMPIMVNGDYSYEVANHYGPNYAMIGDARGFIDPIFSSGVFLSMKTGKLVAAGVHRQLTEGLAVGQAELTAAYKQVTGAYNFVHRMIRLFYNPHAVTWAQVAADGDVHKKHESAMAAGHYMLAGDFFENHERYNKFFDLLEDPVGFRRYAHVVLAREFEPGDASCHAPREVVFGSQLLGTPV